MSWVVEILGSLSFRFLMIILVFDSSFFFHYSFGSWHRFVG